MSSTKDVSPPSRLSAEAARTLTDDIKADAEALWMKLVTAYDGGAHTALGYPSWADYCDAEFAVSKSQAYRWLDAGRIARLLERHSPIGERPGNEGVARELKPLADEPQQLAEAWQETVEQHGPKPTAKQTRAVVEEVHVRKRRPPLPRGTRSKDDRGRPFIQSGYRQVRLRDAVEEAHKARKSLDLWMRRVEALREAKPPERCHVPGCVPGWRVRSRLAGGRGLRVEQHW